MPACLLHLPLVRWPRRPDSALQAEHLPEQLRRRPAWPHWGAGPSPLADLGWPGARRSSLLLRGRLELEAPVG